MARWEFERQKAIVPIFAILNEAQIIKMALDTGATFCLISKEFAGSLDIDIKKPERIIKMMTTEGRCEVPLFTLKSISFLDKTATNVKTIVHDLPENSHVDGLLGLSFLNNFKLTIDFRYGWLEIE